MTKPKTLREKIEDILWGVDIDTWEDGSVFTNREEVAKEIEKLIQEERENVIDEISDYVRYTMCPPFLNLAGKTKSPNILDYFVSLFRFLDKLNK